METEEGSVQAAGNNFGNTELQKTTALGSSSQRPQSTLASASGKLMAVEWAQSQATRFFSLALSRS